MVTNISHTNGNSDTIESGSTYTDSGGEPGIVVGTYGTLTIGAMVLILIQLINLQLML